MWLERFIDMPFMENAGWEDREKFLEGLQKIQPSERAASSQPVIGHAIPMMSCADGTQYLLPPAQHVLVLGATGSGKTRDILAHGVLNLIASQASGLVLDVKGELLDMSANALEKSGCECIRIDFRDMEKSAQYNPLHMAQEAMKAGNHVLAEQITNEVAFAIFPDPKGNSSTDPFWPRSSRQLFTGIALALMELFPSKPCTIPLVRRYIVEIDPNVTSCPLLKAVEEKLGKDSRAYKGMMPIFVASEKTAGNILTSTLADLEPFAKNSLMERIISGNTIDLEKIASGEQQTVIFFEVDDTSPVAYGVARILVSQLNHTLTVAANREAARTLRRPFTFMLDELGNAFALPNFDKMLSMSRSRGITLVSSLQSLTQLNAIYGDAAAETIISNMSAIMVLSTFAPTTWNIVSELCGVNVLGDPLIRPYQIARLKRGQCLVLRRGLRPYMTCLADVETNPNR